MTAESIRRTKAYKKIKASLIDQLERSGNDTPYFLDLVHDYMKLYETKELAAADVAARGVTIFSIGSAGQEVSKKNDSVDMLIKINAQMLKLLDQLRIKADIVTTDEDDEL